MVGASSTASLVARHDGRAPRYTSYPTAASFSDDVDAARYGRWLGQLPRDESVSLYLHVPFCERLCLYCACNTQVVRGGASRRAYAQRLIREIALVRAQIGARLPASAIHWGGGTPTSLAPDDLIAVTQALREAFALDARAAIAVEIDPTTLTQPTIDALKTIGLNRVSLGVQDFDPAVQEAIGRRQSFDDTEACVAAMRAIGASSVNLDLIYGLPRQSAASVRRTALRVLSLAPDRVAVFGYAHVPWMKKHQALIDESTLPGALERYEQQETIRRALVDHGGYVAVGLDHFAKPTDSLALAARSGRMRRNFQGYTSDECSTFLGFGASAIGTLPQGHVQNVAAAAAYAKPIDAGRLATARGVAFSDDDRLRSAAIERLMCDFAVDLPALAQRFGADPEPLLADAGAVSGFVADGLATWDGRRLAVTPMGRAFVRSIAMLFDRHLGQPAAKPRFSRAI